MNLDWNRPRDRRVLAVAALALLGALVAYAIQTKHEDGRGIGYRRSESPHAAAVQVPPAAAALSAATVTVAPRTLFGASESKSSGRSDVRRTSF